MLAALPPSPVERLTGATPTAGRAPAPAPPSGHGFAELLQRGQASHGVLTRPADGSPARAEPPPDSNTEHEIDASSPAQANPDAGAADSRGGAKAVTRAREKAASATAAAPTQTRTFSSESTDDGTSTSPSPTDGSASGASASAVPAANANNCVAALHSPAQAAANAATLQPAGQALADAAAAPLRPTGQAADDAGTAPYSPVSGVDAGEPAPASPLRKATAGDDSPAVAREGVAADARALPTGLVAQSAVLVQDERHAAPREAQAVRDCAPPALIGAGGAVPRNFEPATLAPIALPAPLYSPEFAQVLGAQVSVLARDGVQQAELHLNPAEMGPISVQIQLDGKEARVDFSANAAATREVIERGLPELASALREQGLTLAGGGVFQQAPDSRDKAEGEPTRSTAGSRGRITADAAAAPRAVSIPLPQGRLDLYA